MEEFQYGTAAVRKHIHIPVQGIQMAGTDGTAQAVNALAQVAVAFIQVEHDFFEDKGRNFLKIEKHGGFRMVTLGLTSRILSEQVLTITNKKEEDNL